MQFSTWEFHTARYIAEWAKRHAAAKVRFERNRYSIGEPVSPTLFDADGNLINAGWYGTGGWVDGNHTAPIVALVRDMVPFLETEVRD